LKELSNETLEYQVQKYLEFKSKFIDLVVIDYADVFVPSKSMKDIIGGINVYQGMKTLYQRYEGAKNEK